MPKSTDRIEGNFVRVSFHTSMCQQRLISSPVVLNLNQSIVLVETAKYSDINYISCTYKGRDPAWHQRKTGVSVAYFKMVYQPECEENGRHYKLNDRNDFQFLSAERHFTLDV